MSKKTSQLHALLAVSNSTDTQAVKVLNELVQTTFEKKVHHFGRKVVTFIPLDENQKPVTESQSDIQTTVAKEIEWASQHLIKRIDLEATIGEANTLARADVVLEDGTIFLKSVPATVLLELEKRFTELQRLALSIPTLDPTKGFTPDAQTGTWIARDIVKTRTKKTPRVLVKYEATAAHPAQTEVFQEDVPVGTLNESEWSSLITPAQKSEIINRVEVLLRAVKYARSVANNTTVEHVQIGKSIMDYIFRDLN